MMNASSNPKSPITRSLSVEYTLSLITALLMAAMSVIGLFVPDALYQTEELRRSFLSNDIVNLFIGLPILLGSMAWARRGQLIGLLFLPGALLYVTYNYIAYAVAMPLTWQFIPYVLLVVLSGFIIYRLMTSLDGRSIQQRLNGKIPERFAGGVLAGLGALFFLRGIGQLVQASITGPELAVIIADLLITPLWVIGGILLWRKKPLGYISGAGLLFQASMLFVALLVFFILQPVVAGVPFPTTDFIVVFVMGLVCFVPFGLFVRGMLRNPVG
ncbi:MAG: hypothetical protein HND47_07555 [Chloroflexi bacterium]|nr:hypothetical protein [Chloroflexota bacterium]